MTAFSTVSLPSSLAKAIEVLGFTDMTPVQAQALPVLLKGNDVIAQARTGSGKTLAFAAAALARIDLDVDVVQTLVLCPTRELADQVGKEFRRLARFMPNLRVVILCGGVPVRTQLPSMQRPPHVVVGTPGRIGDHLARGTLDLSQTKTVVLDEADRMLDMGFFEAISEVVAQTPKTRQTALFSATFPHEIKELGRELQRNAVNVAVDADDVDVGIEQHFHEVEPSRRLDAVVALLQRYQPPSSIIFCHTRNDVRDVTERLDTLGYVALALHGELEQWERDEVLLRFSNKSATILVATDVAARGLDIKDVGAVISWELPTDPDVHVHRIGRTGRAGARGLGLHLWSGRERERAEAIAAKQNISFSNERIDLDIKPTPPPPPPMVTLVLDGGKEDKLRPGDILGALTGDIGLPGDAIGKIDIHARRSYVAIRRDVVDVAFEGLRTKRIKNKGFRIKMM